MDGDKVIIISRIRKTRGWLGWEGGWEFYSVYSELNKVVAKDFIAKKNNNANCKYTYKMTIKKLQ